jgi:hypothetical protein
MYNCIDGCKGWNVVIDMKSLGPGPKNCRRPRMHTLCTDPASTGSRTYFDVCDNTASPGAQHVLLFSPSPTCLRHYLLFPLVHGRVASPSLQVDESRPTTYSSLATRLFCSLLRKHCDSKASHTTAFSSYTSQSSSKHRNLNTIRSAARVSSTADAVRHFVLQRQTRARPRVFHAALVYFQHSPSARSFAWLR